MEASPDECPLSPSTLGALKASFADSFPNLEDDDDVLLSSQESPGPSANFYGGESEAEELTTIGVGLELILLKAKTPFEFPQYTCLYVRLAQDGHMDALGERLQLAADQRHLFEFSLLTIMQLYCFSLSPTALLPDHCIQMLHQAKWFDYENNSAALSLRCAYLVTSAGVFFKLGQFPAAVRALQELSVLCATHHAEVSRYVLQFALYHLALHYTEPLSRANSMLYAVNAARDSEFRNLDGGQPFCFAKYLELRDEDFRIAPTAVELKVLTDASHSDLSHEYRHGCHTTYQKLAARLVPTPARQSHAAPQLFAFEQCQAHKTPPAAQSPSSEKEEETRMPAGHRQWSVFVPTSLGKLMELIRESCTLPPEMIHRLYDCATRIAPYIQGKPWYNKKALLPNRNGLVTKTAFSSPFAALFYLLVLAATPGKEHLLGDLDASVHQLVVCLKQSHWIVDVAFAIAATADG